MILKNKKKYNENFKDVEKNLENRTKDSNNIKLYNYYLNYLKRILFSTRKLSDKGLVLYLFFCLKYILIIVQKK